jgi:hypothetical protein
MQYFGTTEYIQPHQVRKSTNRRSKGLRIHQIWPGFTFNDRRTNSQAARSSSNRFLGAAKTRKLPRRPKRLILPQLGLESANFRTSASPTSRDSRKNTIRQTISRAVLLAQTQVPVRFAPALINRFGLCLASTSAKSRPLTGTLVAPAVLLVHQAQVRVRFAPALTNGFGLRLATTNDRLKPPPQYISSTPGVEYE